MKQLVLALSRLFREALLEVEEVLGAPSVRPVAPVSRPEVGTVVYPAWDCDTDAPAFGLVCPDPDGVWDPQWVAVQWSDRDYMSLHLVRDILVAPGCELVPA